MQLTLNRKLVLASAGAGKSRLIVKSALKKAGSGKRVLIVTYTENNQEELAKKICELNNGTIPSNITIKGWFAFLLEEMVRPYQSFIFEERIPTINFNSTDPHKRGQRNIPGRAEKINNRYNKKHFLTLKSGKAHTTYISKLSCRVNKEANGKPAFRLSQIYDGIYIDEVQDLTGWDYDVLTIIAKSSLSDLICVGDFRQTLYSTHISPKKPKTNQDKVKRFCDMGFATEELNISWRSIQQICDFADLIHSDEKYKETQSKVTDINVKDDLHSGVFVIKEKDARTYIDNYKPVLLRTSRRSYPELCTNQVTYNFGESKGMGFDHVLICTTDKQKSFVSGNMNAFNKDKTSKARNSFYVAITRARFSVGLICDTEVKTKEVTTWVSDGLEKIGENE